MAKGLAHEILVDVKRCADAIGHWPNRDQYERWDDRKIPMSQLYDTFGNWTNFQLAAGKAKVIETVDEGDGPKVYFIDIETAPGEYYAFDPRVEYLRKDQQIKDFTILSWAAKKMGSDEVTFRSTQGNKHPRDDSALMLEMWKILDDADIVIGQNSDRFDIPKIYARMMFHRTKDRHPPSSFKRIDTKKIAKRYFGFTYNSLEHLCDYLDVKYKKLKHDKFPGMSLQIECLNGNAEAWAEMERYNIRDILALEECWKEMRAWDSAVNANLYHGSKKSVCRVPGCGGVLQGNGYYYTSAGKFNRYRCANCGAEARGRENILSKRKKENLKLGVPR